MTRNFFEAVAYAAVVTELFPEGIESITETPPWGVRLLDLWHEYTPAEIERGKVLAEELGLEKSDD